MTGLRQALLCERLTSGRVGGPLGEGDAGLPALPDPGLLFLRQDAFTVPMPACQQPPQHSHQICFSRACPAIPNQEPVLACLYIPRHKNRAISNFL